MDHVKGVAADDFAPGITQIVQRRGRQSQDHPRGECSDFREAPRACQYSPGEAGSQKQSGGIGQRRQADEGAREKPARHPAFFPGLHQKGQGTGGKKHRERGPHDLRLEEEERGIEPEHPCSGQADPGGSTALPSAIDEDEEGHPQNQLQQVDGQVVMPQDAEADRQQVGVEGRVIKDRRPPPVPCRDAERPLVINLRVQHQLSVKDALGPVFP